MNDRGNERKKKESTITNKTGKEGSQIGGREGGR